jgi:hypothetical protein
MLNVEALHRIRGCAGRGFRVEPFRVCAVRTSVQQQQAASVLNEGDWGPWHQLQCSLKVLDRTVGGDLVGKARRKCAQFADDLGVIQTERDMRLGVARLEFERSLELLPDASGKSVGERLEDRGLLAVAPENECIITDLLT